MQPLITVNILSFNRKDDLRHTLQKVFEQDYKNIEVIVVDNNSRDGSVGMVKSEFPAVRLIELWKNIGIAGWNEGAKIAKGEYLLFLDDDSYPAQDTLLKAFSSFNTEIILALNIRHPSKPEFDPKYLSVDSCPTFIGCGVIIPKNIFIELNGFEKLLFLYLHEEEFSIRALNAGYSIKYLPNAIVFHTKSEIHRGLHKNVNIDKRKQYYFIRNTIVILVFHFPLYIAFSRIVRMGMGWLIFACCYGGVYNVVKGIIAGVVVILHNWNQRSVVSKNVMKVYKYGKCFASFFGNGVYAFRRPTWLQ